MKFGADHDLGRTDVDIGTIYWEKLQDLMDMDEASNRLNRGNAFGAWEYVPPEYEYDKKGKRTLVKEGGQEFVARSPGMQAAQDRMDRRLEGEGFEDYERPSQVSALTDALLATRMEKMGLIDEGVADLKQDSYGDRIGDINPRPAPMPPTANPQPPTNPMPPDPAQPPPNTTRPPIPPDGNPRNPPGVSKPLNMSPEQMLMAQMMSGGAT